MTVFKYIVLTSGRYEHPGVHMDVQTVHERVPMSLEMAKERAAQIEAKEPEVKAYVAELVYVAERAFPPVRIRRVK